MTTNTVAAGSHWPELERVAVLMPSCDRYGSLWPISLEALERYWPDRPDAIYLAANHRVYERKGVRQLLIGDDVSWSDNLLQALQQMREDYVFLALDDLVMLPGTDATLLNDALSRAVQQGWDYLRVNPLPPPRAVGADGIGRSAPGEAYRSATVWSLWKRSVLQKVLRPGESAWAFEKTGSARTDEFEQWWASAVRRVAYVNVVTGGRADPRVLRELADLGFDFSKLEFLPMSPAEVRRLRLRLLRSKLLKLVPWSLRRAVLQALAKP